MVADFAAFNPHASFSCGEWHYPASVPEWKKWRTDEPPSAHWYRPSDLRNLIAAYLAHESDDCNPLVRDFVTQFAGLSGTQVRQKVLATAAIVPGTRLSDLVAKNDVDLERVTALLSAMRDNSKPIKPARLGIIGKEHIQESLKRYGGEEGFKYQKIEEKADEEGLPYVVEVAFALKKNKDSKLTKVIGLNWSPVLKVPYGALSRALNDCRVQDSDPVVLFIHAARPRFAFADHGKGAIAEDE